MSAAAASSCRLLVVDDEEANLELLEQILAPEGFTDLVRTADAREALPLFEREQPDLVLLDLHMPHRSGFEILADIRARTPAAEYLPVLVLTADASPAAKERALSGGAKDFLLKPLDATEVCLRVRNLLETRLLYREQQAARRAAELAARRTLAVVAHDLRNPLASIVAHAEMLRNLLPPRAAAQQRQGLARIEEIAQRTTTLVEDLLAIARPEHGALAVRPRPVAPAALLEEAEAMLAPLAARRAVRLTFDGPRAAPAVLADAARVLQVLSNLVGNALRFTPAEAGVRVSWGVEGAALVVAVADSGPGIPPDRAAQIFGPFWQNDPSDRRDTGLGLVIARAVVEAHGGRIWLESNPGAGATFRFSLPLADEATPVETAAPAPREEGA